VRQHHEKSPLRGNGLRNYNSPNNPQALEITGLLGRFVVRTSEKTSKSRFYLDFLLE
jgi:hypothetical protein